MNTRSPMKEAERTAWKDVQTRFDQMCVEAEASEDIEAYWRNLVWDTMCAEVEASCG